jgi:hypothetical protein
MEFVERVNWANEIKLMSKELALQNRGTKDSQLNGGKHTEELIRF